MPPKELHTQHLTIAQKHLAFLLNQGGVREAFT